MADAHSVISHGALLEISRGQTIQNPILQCVQIKPMAAGVNGEERWRVVFNDTINFIQGMIAMQSNHLITDGLLKKGSICRLTQFSASFVKDKYILVIISLDVLAEYGELEKMGDPQALPLVKSEEQDAKPQPGNITGNNFYGNRPQAGAQQPAQQQSRALPSRGNASGGSHGNIHPIEAITPYAHKWTIKARCTHKGEIKHWHNKNGDGKLFSANFLDDSGEIRATGFNEQVDQYYDLLQEGGVYYISNPCRVQLAKKQFSTVNNDYELTFEKDTHIEKAEDMDGVPEVRYNFVTLEALQNIEKDNNIDVVGILQDVGETAEITSKSTGKPYNKRELTLVDQSGYSVRLTVWGKTAESFEAPTESVVAFKGVKVSDFGGRSLSLTFGGSMTVNPDIDEAFKLKGWWDGSGRTEQFQSHQNTMSLAGATGANSRDATKTIAQIRDENLGMSDEADFFNIKATVIYIKQDNFAYPGCRSEGCNKKVIDEGDGRWHCARCEKSWETPEWRYIMSVNVSDHTGQIWLSCFNETGVQLMGMTASELQAIKEQDDGDKRAGDAFQDATCKSFIFRVKAKMDNFQEQQRVRYQVQSSNPLDFAREGRKLAQLIKQYSIADDGLFVR